MKSCIISFDVLAAGVVVVVVLDNMGSEYYLLLNKPQERETGRERRSRVESKDYCAAVKNIHNI